MPDLDFAEKQRIQRANQIFLRLRKELHDRDAQFAEKDVREAAQSARWLREIIEQYAGDWEQTYEDALTESELTEEDEAYLQGGINEAGGFSPFVQSNLRRLEEAAPDEVETGEPAAARIAHQDLMCGMVAGLVAGGVMMRNFFYFGFAVGMSRKAGCWQD
jgi:predicted DNA-binding protein